MTLLSPVLLPAQAKLAIPSTTSSTTPKNNLKVTLKSSTCIQVYGRVIAMWRYHLVEVVQEGRSVLYNGVLHQQFYDIMLMKVISQHSHAVELEGQAHHVLDETNEWPLNNYLLAKQLCSLLLKLVYISIIYLWMKLAVEMKYFLTT